MPGIFGFTHPNLDDAAHQRLGQMAEALHDEAHYQAHLHHQPEISLGRVGLPIILPQPQPAWNEDHQVAVVLEGEIYDAALHRRHLENQGHRFNSESHAELVAHLYEQSGPNFAAGVNGAFVAAIWDGARQRLLLVNDHLGLQPLYYTPNLPGGFAFASGVRALLAFPNLPRNLDRLAMAQFLTFDHVLDDRTLLEEVKLLPGGSTLTWQDGQWRIERYWRPQYPEHYPVRDEADYRHELLGVLRQAAKRQMPGAHPAGILMSGGLDSRVVAALLHEQRQGEKIATFTMGQPGCDDERFAKEVSEQLHMPHHFHRLKGDYLLEYVAKGVRLSDGMGNAVHMHTLPNLSAQAQQAHILYKGFLGDALIGYGITPRLWATYDATHLPLAHFATHRDQGVILFDMERLDQVMLPQNNQPFSRPVMDSYLSGMKAARTDLPADQRNYFDLCQRVPRMTLHGVEWVRSQAHVRLPFADKDLVEFMLTVPPGYRFGRKIIKDLFIEQFPELAKIPYTETNYPMLHCRREVTLRANEQLRWWLRSRGLKWVSIPTKRPYAHYNEWLRGELRPWMEAILLSKRTFERGIFDPAALKTLVAEHLAGQKHYTRLGALISIELWQRQFLDGHPA
jgi:asparagine synthase (glutamine-hydrolysing)